VKTVSAVGVFIAVWGIMGAVLAQPVDSSVPDPPNPHFYYRMENPLDGYADRLTLETGELRIGKILEWGTLVYFWDKTTGERYAYKRSEVRNMERVRSEAVRKKPNLPDLTVAYIERTPRDQGWHNVVKYDLKGKKGLGVLMIDPTKYQLHPAPGQKVTFTVHVLNAGLVASKPCHYEVLMDDKPIDDGDLGPIPVGKEHAVAVEWSWREGQHYIKVLLDTENANTEIAKWNNTFIDPVRALTFFFVIGSNTYKGFANNPNLVDTFNFEDWAQYHVHGMNWLFMNSIWPSAPDGILERVRIDKILVYDGYPVPKPEDGDAEQQARWAEGKQQWEQKQEAAWDRERRYNNDPGEPIMFNGNWHFGDNPDEAAVATWAAGHDWGLPHELGHQLGLVDLYWMNHGMQDVLVKNEDGNYQNVMHFYPWPTMMMHWHGPHIFSEIHAGYLNHTLGRPRGFFGDFYYQIPKKNFMKVHSNTGKPLEGVQVSLYQRWVDPDNTFIVGDWRCPWAYGPDPVFAGKTGKDGRFLLPNQKVTPHDTPEPGYHLRDNPWGQINVVGDNVLLLAKINYEGMEEFHWLRLHDANVGYLRGQTEEFTYEIRTRFPDAGAPEPPQELKPVFHVRLPEEQPGLTLRWRPSPSSNVVEYRCYLRTSHGDMSVRPYRLFNVVPTEKVGGDGWYASGAQYWKDLRPDLAFYGADSYLAVTAVDADGKESALSNVIYIPDWSAHNVNVAKVAIGSTGQFYISINAGETQLLAWDEKRGLREIGFRDIEVPHAFPHFGGIALDAQDRLVATEPGANRIGLWSLGGDRIKLVGEKGAGPAQFDGPSDVAIDSRGRIYVADTRNHRVQVFDSDLNYVSTFGSQGDGEMQFQEPGALGITDDKLAVTDGKLGRVLVFDVNGDRPQQVREVPKVQWQTDRALMAPSGNVYATDYTGLTVYGPDGAVLRRIEQMAAGAVYHPRGLCADGQGNGYFVNSLPFATVMSIKLE
jgi:hypothetical protein